jgi:spectrin beta
LDVGFSFACKPLKFVQQYRQVLETDMSQWDQKISDLVELGKEMAHEGHFDADNILSASCNCQEK